MENRLRGIGTSVDFLREWIESTFHHAIADIREIHQDVKGIHKTYQFKADTLLEAKKLISKFNDIKRYNDDIVHTLKKELALRVERKETYKPKVPKKVRENECGNNA
jgi:hypothetical protein